jgi:CDP-diacylglycerol--glycerol-3-phosphate 3-phosphatidyltransferase
LAVYGSEQGSSLIVILALISLVGAYLVSYTRARAEGLGMDCKVGLFSRLERIIVILIMLFTGWIVPGLWVLAIGTQFTTLQRIWHVRQQANIISSPNA